MPCSPTTAICQTWLVFHRHVMEAHLPAPLLLLQAKLDGEPRCTEGTSAACAQDQRCSH